MSRTLTCAIQIGTSRICAAAAWRDQIGNYEIAAIETEQSAGCVRRGCIVDVDAAAAHIKSLIMKLSNRVKSYECRGIEAAYVGISGISMHSKLHHPSVQLEDGAIVNNDIISSLRLQSLHMQMPGLDILGLEPMGYTLDDVDCLNPSGRTGSQLTAHQQIIIGQQRIRNGVKMAMEKAGIRLIGLISTPLSTAQILTADEKQRGCVLIDLGHSLTTVSVYADGVLQYLSTIPLGSNAVTNDISSAGLSWDDAEKAKINWSNVSGENSTEFEDSSMPIKQNDLNLICTCRYEEIAANIANQIKLSECKDRIAAGCVITGGASLQRGLIPLLNERLGIQRISVRSYSKISYGQSEKRPQLAALTTMLSFCNVDCETRPVASKPVSAEKEVQKPVEVITPVKPVEKPIQPEVKNPTPQNTPTNNGGSKLSRFLKDLVSGFDE